MWTYLTTPFLFAMDGMATEELEPWRENGEMWRRLKVTFPQGIATHSTVQTFYVGRTACCGATTTTPTSSAAFQLRTTFTTTRRSRGSRCRPGAGYSDEARTEYPLRSRWS